MYRSVDSQKSEPLIDSPHCTTLSDLHALQKYKYLIKLDYALLEGRDHTSSVCVPANVGVSTLYALNRTEGVSVDINITFIIKFISCPKEKLLHPNTLSPFVIQ